MAWSYSGDPAASSLDEARFLVGDTDSTDELLQDAEVTYAIGKYGTLDTAGNGPTKYQGVGQAAVDLCLALAAKFSRLVDVVDDTVRASFSQRAAAFRSRADDLKRQLVAPLAGPWAGNYDLAYQQSVATDDSLVQPIFSVGMTDNPGTTIDLNTSPGPFVEVVPD